MDEQNAHTEEQENQSALEYSKELEESKEEEKEEDTREHEFQSSKQTKSKLLYFKKVTKEQFNNILVFRSKNSHFIINGVRPFPLLVRFCYCFTDIDIISIF